jgi:hypothetical protein
MNMHTSIEIIYIYVHVLKPTTVPNLLKRGVAEAIQLPSLQNGDMAEVSVEIPMIFQ